MFFVYGMLFALMYALGWSLVAVPIEHSMFFVMGLFLIVNTFTILNQKLYSISIIKPLQLSNASIFIYSFLNNDGFYALISALLFISFVVMEWEDFVYVKREKKLNLFEKIKYLFQFSLLPFAVTYCVMIFRPEIEMFGTIVIIVYFTVLFFSAKYLVNKSAIVLFVITQIIGFVYLMGQYNVLNPTELIMFVFAVSGFLVINQGRKGLLEYLEK